LIPDLGLNCSKHASKEYRLFNFSFFVKNVVGMSSLLKVPSTITSASVAPV